MLKEVLGLVTLFIVIGASVLAVLVVTDVLTYHVSTIHTSTSGLIVSEGLNLDRSTIDWGTLNPGDNTTEVVQVTNGDKFNTTLYFTLDWTPPEAADFIGIAWNYTGAPVQFGETVPLALTLTVSPDVENITTFDVDINFAGVT